MDEALLKSGQYPNIAIEAGTDPAEVMREHGRKVIPDGEKYELADTREHSKAECPHSNVSQNSSDTREQLEADIRAWHRDTPFATKPSVQTLLGWLDRQAAITERECMKQATTRYIGWDCAECAEGLGKELDARCDPLKERIAELTAEVEKHRQRANDAERGVLSYEWYVARDRYEDDIAELTSERDELGEKNSRQRRQLGELQDAIRERNEGVLKRQWQRRVDELEAERDELKKELKHECAEWESERDYANQCEERVKELTAERDNLNEKLGKITEAISELMKKQPRTFDPHDVPGSLRDVGRYIDELELRLVGKPRCDLCDRTTLLVEIDGLAAERDQLSRDLEAEHALVVQFEHDNEELRHANNTLRASVAGLKMTVERFKARESREPSDVGN